MLGSFATLERLYQCNERSSRFESLIFTQNVVNAFSPSNLMKKWYGYYGDGVFWLINKNHVEISNCLFHKDNKGNRARDIFSSNSNTHSNIALISNVHLFDTTTTTTADAPAIVTVFNSCDEVPHGFRGFIKGNPIILKYWIRVWDGSAVLTRCSFIATGKYIAFICLSLFQCRIVFLVLTLFFFLQKHRWYV